MENKKLNILKQCVICHKQINRKKERYVHLIDYNGKIKDNECFYHLDCWKNKFTIQREKAMNEVRKMFPGVIENLNKVMELQQKC
jgi:hypothetical protein